MILQGLRVNYPPNPLSRAIAREKRGVGRLEEAPWLDRPDLGIHHILGWKDKGLLEIPENSLIRSQLQTLQADQVKTVPETMNAVNALRFLVCGFEKYKPVNTDQNWRKKMPHRTWLTT